MGSMDADGSPSRTLDLLTPVATWTRCPVFVPHGKRVHAESPNAPRNAHVDPTRDPAAGFPCSDADSTREARAPRIERAGNVATMAPRMTPPNR